jgi:hypothetical protein
MVAEPRPSRSTIPRRIGWARALKGSLAITLTISVWGSNLLVTTAADAPDGACGG